MSYIVYAIPIFFLLIGIEVLVDKLHKTKYYRFNDAITNLSLGIGSQVVGRVLLGTITILGYKYIYAHWRLMDMPSFEHSSPAWQVVLTWIALFIGVDFFYYWFHRLAHEISFLWGSHIVHHQSEEYNLTVALRQAWLQGAFSWVFYLPLAFVGFDTTMFITVASFQTLYQFWIHTKTIDKMPRFFEYVLNTPSHHRVHHGVNPEYIDKNHGGTFIIFDRMFGTFAPERDEVVYGITTQTNSWNPLWVNFDYWLNLSKETLKAPKLSHKAQMLVRGPGWRPLEMGGPMTVKPVDKVNYRKYDTQIPSSLNYYVLLHYIIAIAGTSLFLLMANKIAYLNQLAISGVIIFTIVSIGGLLEGKRWAFGTEIARIIMLAGLLAWLLPLSYLPIILAVSIAFLIVSIAWLYRHRSIFSAPAHNLA